MSYATEVPTSPRDWWVPLGLTVSALSALVSSFSGLRDLAVVSGWSVYLAPLLPLTIDSLAMTATRIWLAHGTAATRARRVARTNALGAILLSLVGNAADHLIAAHLLPVSWLVVLAVGAVPPVVLALNTHLAVLRRQEVPLQPTAPGPSGGPGKPKTVPAPEEPPRDRPQVRDMATLIAVAREADATHRAAHNGKPITRDELRRALHVGGERATSVLRQLRAQSAGRSPAIPQHSDLDRPDQDRHKKK